VKRRLLRSKAGAQARSYTEAEDRRKELQDLYCATEAPYMAALARVPEQEAPAAAAAAGEEGGEADGPPVRALVGRAEAAASQARWAKLRDEIEASHKDEDADV
jgi:hypothetical protein